MEDRRTGKRRSLFLAVAGFGLLALLLGAPAAARLLTRTGEGMSDCVAYAGCSCPCPPDWCWDGGEIKHCECGGGDVTPSPSPPTGVPPPPPTDLPSTPDPGSTGTPVPGPTPGPTEEPAPPPDVEMACYDCAPWAYCPSGYGHICVVRDNRTSPPLEWIHSWSCHPDGFCDSSTPTPPPEETPTPVPCIPSPPDMVCEEEQWGYYIWVEARVPPHRVQVDPFPRWLVGMGAPLPPPYESGEPGRLTLMDYPAFTPPGLCAPNGPGFSEGCWSDPAAFPERGPDEEPQPGDIRDYRLGLRWRRVRADQPDPNDLGPVPPVCWDFDEREWNIGADYGYGPIPAMECGSTIVSHIYETSSWGKPHNGPRFVPPEEACPPGADHCCEQVPSGDGEWDMPAYQVWVYTTWAAEYATKWEAWEQVGTDWSECGWSGVDPTGSPSWQFCGDPPPGICVGVHGDPPTEWWGRWGEPRYEWVEHFEGWNPIDLQAFGSGSWYYTSWAVVTTGEGPWCAFEYADPNPGDTVRVAVVEGQSVLREP